MKNMNHSMMVVAIGLSFAIGAFAQSMSKDQYKSSEKSLEGDYKTARSACDSLSGNANDICIAEAKGNHLIAKAKLEDTYQSTTKTRHEMRIAKADASYMVSMEKCDDRAGNEKDVCAKEAKAAKVSAIADAEAQSKSSAAELLATEKASVANNTAMEKSNEAKKDANTDKRNADYAVAKEKCDSQAGASKEKCITDAKVRFNQS